MAKDKDCELCSEERLTPWLYEDKHFFVAICISCDLPMVVLRDHRIDLSDNESSAMKEILTKSAVEYFDNTPFFVDDVMRQIPNHKHMHARRRPQVPNF
ncbi:MAG: hypothetical protein M0Z45_03075 [Actinomycetota bacterium]|nr:hypothetical protein [Actinomycetota bacterium]